MTRSARGIAFILLAFSFVFAACNRDRKKLIAVIPKGNAHLFWQSVHAGAVAASQENNVDVVWNGPPNETDLTVQLKTVETMINRRVDAIALAPIDETALVSVVERAVAAGIPVIIFDSGLKSDKVTTQVSTDNYGAGQLGGERMGKILNGKGNIVMVKVQPGGASTMAREDGFKNVIQTKFPGIKILDERYGMADFAQSRTVAENMLTANPNLDGIFGSNESSSVGAAQALISRKGNAKLVGFDWSPGLLEDVKAGRIDSLVIQDPFKMGHEAVTAAVRTLKGEKLPKKIDLEPRLVDRDNLGSPAIQAQVNPDLKKYLK